MYIEEIKWEEYPAIMATRYSIISIGGCIARARIKDLYEVEIHMNPQDFDDYTVRVKFYDTINKNKSYFKIGSYSTKKESFRAAEDFIRWFDVELLEERQIHSNKWEQDPFIEYYSCSCSKYLHNPTYRPLPATTGCICIRKNWRPRQSEANFKRRFVGGSIATVLDL